MRSNDARGNAWRDASITLRALTPADVDTLVALHAASWRRAYRGILGDDYLDGDLVAERRAVWAAKLRDDEPGVGWLALDEAVPVGFVFVRPRADAQWGTLVDNLHVLPTHQGRGLGRALLHTVGAWCTAHVPEAGIHLWVFRDNTSARAFYARLGGREAELVEQLASDGRVLPEYRVVWARGGLDGGR